MATLYPSPPSSPGSASPTLPQPPSPLLPTHTYHSSLLPRSIPTPALLDSVAGAAHYSGVDSIHQRRRSVRGDAQLHRRESARRQSDLPAGPNIFHLAVMDDLKDMYEGHATKQMLQRRWRKDAEFEDPLTRCRGFHEIAPQWYALPRMYSHLAVTGRRVLSSTQNPDRLIMWQKLEYTARVTGSKKVVESILVIDFDEDGKIARMIDQRHGLEPSTRWGAQHLRRLSGRVVPWVPWLSRSPKPRPSHH